MIESIGKYVGDGQILSPYNENRICIESGGSMLHIYNVKQNEKQFYTQSIKLEYLVTTNLCKTK